MRDSCPPAQTRGMTTRIDMRHPAPVPMQSGRHDDRIVLARLRVERRWIVRDRDKAGLTADPARHNGSLRAKGAA